MRRPLLALAVAAVVSAPVLAQAPEAGRYEIAPSAAGFIRLDTRTGATSHCTNQAGVWRCEPLIEDVGRLEAELAALSAKVSGLTEALAEMGVRVDALAARFAEHPAATVDIEPSADGRNFVAAAMDRLFKLVRILKHGRDAAA